MSRRLNCRHNSRGRGNDKRTASRKGDLARPLLERYLAATETEGELGDVRSVGPRVW